MDNVTRLISELHSKLSELDNKVAAYRQDMTAEFQRYSDHLLQHAPDHVSSAVSRAVAESLSGYHSLYPGLATPDSPVSEGDKSRLWNGRKSPPPILYHTSGIPTRDGLRSPHEHERELQGLFTPPYLPLLDSSDRPLHLPPVPLPPAAPSDGLRATEGTQTTEGLEGLQGLSSPTRRPTDTSSVDSSGSENRARRSAMRRSSNASAKASPRRVRFDFQGKEVLPTASPQASGVGLPQLGNDAPPPQASIYDSEQRPPLGPTDPAIEENLPPARKVSSSERLRALSKIPLEDPANWTVVNPQSDPEESAATHSEARPNTWAPSDPTQAAPARPRVVTTEKTTLTDEELGSPLQDLERHEDDNSSEEEFISMKPSKRGPTSPSPRQSPSSIRPDPIATRKSTATSPAKMPTQPATPSGDIAAETKEGAANGKPKATGSAAQREDSRQEDEAAAGTQAAEDSDDEPVFDFDDDSIGSSLTRAAKERAKEDAAKEDSEAHDEPFEDDESESKTPPMPVPHRASPPVAPSVGSYRGRPITTFDVVKDPLLHARAAELGDFNTFVGSVDGRSGVDGGDVNSFRASLSGAQYSGTPRSLSERMAMEETLGRHGRGEGRNEGRGEGRSDRR